MKLKLIALLGFALGAVSGAASASESSDWSAGAGLRLGLGLSGTVNGGAIALGGLLGSPTVSLERRISDSLWLMLEAHGGISSVDGTEAGARARQFGGAIGPRLILTHDLPVELSGFVTAGLDASFADGPSAAHADAKVFSAAAGLALERELVPDLSLRFSTPLLTGSWSEASSSGAGSASHAEAWSVALNLAPTLTLQMAF